MSTQITNYQCPACTGPMHFDGQTGKLRCDYCDSTYTIQEVEALFEEKMSRQKTSPRWKILLLNGARMRIRCVPTIAPPAARS